MDELYRSHGVKFRFPGDWALNEQRTGSEEVTVTVSSPETSFWSLSLYFDRPDPEALIETAVDAFRDEYDELDDYPVECRVCRRPATGRDLEFVCLELINSAFLRAFRTPRFSALVLYQGTDHELADTREILEGITASLQYTEGPATPGDALRG